MMPLWIEDLLDLSGQCSPAELQKLIEREPVVQSEWDIPPAFSYIYNKYDRGEIFPGPDRIELWRTFCAAVERVPKLLLWYVLYPEPFTSDAAVYVWDRLAPDIKRVVRPSRMPSFSRLRRLAALCNVDALTALLMLIRLDLDQRRPKDPPGKAYYMIPHAQEAFFRLSVFPPFQNLRRLFYRHVGALAFTMEYNGELIRNPGLDLIATEATNDLILLMEGLGKIGLLGPSLGEQIKFVNWYRSHINEETKRSMYHHCFAKNPVTMEPQDPLWQALKRLRHPATRNGRSILLPWKGRVISDFRIANVLGEAEFRLPEGAKRAKCDRRRLVDMQRRFR
jgi:hypothetical protein